MKAGFKTREMWASAGVSVGETDAPAESAPASGNGRAGGDYVVHKIQRQDLDWAGSANDGVLFHREAGKTAHSATGGGFHGVSTADDTFDAGTKNQVGDGAGKCKIGDESPVACGNWHQPTRTVNERCH